MTVERIVDGDTITAIVDLAFGTQQHQWLRLARVNTPEIKGPEQVAGAYVTNRVHAFFRDRQDKPLFLQSHDWQKDSFGRVIATIWCGETNLNDWLLHHRLAFEADANGRLFDDTRDLRKLDLPDGVVQSWVQELS